MRPRIAQHHVLEASTLVARPRRRGFTLVELVLVAAIISVLAAIVGSRYGTAIVHQRVEAAARRIVLDVALAQRQARLASASRTITFLGASDKYRLLGVQRLDRTTAGDYETQLSDEPYRAQIVSADFGGDQNLVFDGFGVPDSGGTVVVRVGDVQRTVTVDPDTGRASVQ